MRTSSFTRSGNFSGSTCGSAWRRISCTPAGFRRRTSGECACQDSQCVNYHRRRAGAARARCPSLSGNQSRDCAYVVTRARQCAARFAAAAGQTTGRRDRRRNANRGRLTVVPRHRDANDGQNSSGRNSGAGIWAHGASSRREERAEFFVASWSVQSTRRIRPGSSFRSASSRGCAGDESFAGRGRSPSTAVRRAGRAAPRGRLRSSSQRRRLAVSERWVRGTGPIDIPPQPS